MKRRLRSLPAISLLALLAYTITGCNESTMLGQNLIPGVDNIHTFQTDTFLVTSHTVYDPDSLATSFTSRLTTGAINSDAAFGTTTAIGYTQLGLSTGEFVFQGDAPVLDSVVFSANYAGAYGDTLSAQTLHVYRITDPSFNDTTLYYAFQQFQLDPGSLGSTTVTPKGLQDSVSIWGTTEAPQLRIRLSDAFGNALMQQLPGGAFLNDSSFHEYLRGLAIVPDSSGSDKRSLIYLNLNSTVSGLTVYYHNNTTDSLRAFFPITPSSCATSNYLRRDYSNSEAEKYFNTTTETGDSLIFLQERPGLYTNIEIPNLQNFPNAIINDAQLILTQVVTPGSEPGIFSAPSELFLFQYKKAGKDSIGFPFDVGAFYNPNTGQYQYSNLAGFGGFALDTVTGDGQKIVQYRFNISRYLQHLIANKDYNTDTNYGFKLEVFNAAGLPDNHGRVILGGGTHSRYAMKLRVIYTKLK